MKKIILLILLSLPALYSLGQAISIISQNKDHIIIKHTINTLELENGLPSYSHFILLPNDAQPKTELVSFKNEIKNIKTSYRHTIDIQNQSEVIPYFENTLTNIRGFNFLLINISPFQYDSINNNLNVFYDINLKISYNTRNSSYGDDRYRDREWDNILRDISANPEMIDDFDYDNNVRNILDNNLEGCQYLIVTPNNSGISQWADTLAKFRNEQGILTKVVSLDDIGKNHPVNIKNYFNYIYKNWELVPSAILLFGDYDLDDAKGISSFYPNNHPDKVSYLADNKLVDFNNDDLPEIVIARIPAENAQQAETIVRKTINYERNPSLNPNYYDHPITAMGFEESRWFQLCSEIIAGFFEKTGKHPTRLNAIISGTPDSLWSTAKNTDVIIDFFGPNGLGYIPSDLSHLTKWNTNQNDLCNAINEGSFLVQYRGHGEYQAWSKPNFSNRDINDLNNKDLTFVMSSNCRNGNFNYGKGDNDCFAERFMRVSNGCVAIIAASETSYSFVNDTYVWGCYDYLWNDFMPSYGSSNTNFKYPAFANTYGKYFLKRSSWPKLELNKNITYNLFHYFGDAFLKLNTEMPQNIAISYPKEITTEHTSISIKKDNDTKIALSVNGKIIAVSTDNDSIINIAPQKSGRKIKVVATKQDHYRHEGFIEVKSLLNENDLHIYPNPTKDILFVESKGIQKIEVYNCLGQILMEFNNDVSNEKISIDCNMLKKGLFHLHLIYEDKRVGKSFIVN